jgi:hypothetical protein
MALATTATESGAEHSVDANDLAAARALQPQLDAQARLIDIIRLKIEGMLEAMDALQRAATLGALLQSVSQNRRNLLVPIRGLLVGEGQA